MGFFVILDLNHKKPKATSLECTACISDSDGKIKILNEYLTSVQD